MREDGAVIDECAADDEGVGEVKGGHGGKLVDVGAADEDGFGVVLSNCVVKAEGFGEESRWHTGPEREDEEGEEIA